MYELIYDMPISEQIAEIAADQAADDRSDVRHLTRAERRRRARAEVTFAADRSADIASLVGDWWAACGETALGNVLVSE